MVGRVRCLAQTFEAFLAGCHADSQVTLKRFGLLCAKGAADPRGLARLLVSGAPQTPCRRVDEPVLNCLRNWTPATPCWPIAARSCICLPVLDGLVPAEAASDLLTLLPDVEIGLIEQAGHAFLLEDPHGVAGAIQAFLHECVDD